MLLEGKLRGANDKMRCKRIRTHYRLHTTWLTYYSM